MWILDPWLIGEKLCNVIISQCVGLDYTVFLPLLPVLLWFLLYIFGSGKSFLLVFRSFSQAVVH